MLTRLLLSVSVVLSAGCGGDSSGSPPPTTPTPPPAPIQTIAESTGGRVATGGGSSPLVLGQSVTIRQGPFNALVFQWQRTDALGAIVPSATGRVLLFNREYEGPIASMSASAEGFIALAPSVNDEYVFDSALVLQPGKYWFYSNDQTQTLLSSNGNQDLYADGEMYASNAQGFVVFFPFGRGERIDANFVLKGRPVR